MPNQCGGCGANSACLTTAVRLRCINFLVTVILLATTACGAQDDAHRNSEHGDEELSNDGAAPKQFDAHGLVKSITPNGSHLVVAHGDVPGFMNAMTMPFSVADETLLSDVSANDSIRFVIEVDGPKISIISLEVID